MPKTTNKLSKKRVPQSPPDPNSSPHVRDTPNDPAPSKGTNEPWNRPGQLSQDPSLPDPSDIDLETWHKSSTH